MELKPRTANSEKTNKYGLNRTFMELKLGDKFVLHCESNCLNRTFMELKQPNHFANPHPLLCLNRTFMELKRRGAMCAPRRDEFESHLYGIETTYAPPWYPMLLWFESHLYGIETILTVEGLKIPHGLNRTFMELKRFTDNDVTFDKIV